MRNMKIFPIILAVSIAVSCGGGGGSPPASEPAIDIYAFGQCTTQPGNNFDMRLKKYDAAGNEVSAGWDLNFDDGNSDYGSNNCMGVDSEGNIYIAYWAYLPSTGYDWRIRKFAPSGAEAAGWDKRVGTDGSGRSGTPVALLVDSSDEVYAVGITVFEGTNNDWQIKKYHSDGTEIAAGWDKIEGVPATSDYPVSAALGPDRSLYVLGVINGTYLVKKYSPNGAEDAAYAPAIAADLYPSEIAVEPAGSLYLGGFRYVDAANREDWFIKKYSAAGIEIAAGWDKTVDYEGHNDAPHCLALDREDSLYAAGSLISADASAEYERIVKYMADGATSWELTLDAGVFSRVNSIAFGPEGEAYVLGYFKGSDEGLSRDWRILRISREGSPDLDAWNLSFDANSGQNTGQSIVAVF